MSYREKPQLKLYKYENNSFILQAIIDDYQECSFEDNLYEAGQFSITINFNIPNSQLFQRGLFIQFGNSWKFGEINKIQDQIGEDGKGSQFRIITGYDARYILKRRVIKNMNSNGLWVMTGKGEIVLRNLINDQAGTNAEQKRRLPIINTIPTPENAIGKEYSASEQFSNLYEVCKTIATQSEIGWRLEFNGTSLTLVCFNGTDRTQTVQFSTSFDSLANGEFVDSSESFSNAIYVGGKGQNDDRDIYEGESAIEGNSPSGLDRYESWDNQSSMTTESEYENEALSMLNQYGQTLTMSGNGLAKCPYEYEKEYFVGDKIKIAFSGKSANAQILSVTEHWAFGAYEINFSFGKPLPDLNAQLQLILKQIQKASNKTDSTDSVRWYEIPTDTEMPASDVTYRTIGFVGNCASEGSTFTLYLDDEKTGAKTYHVYFKQLGGGKLTLTTGKAGATDLVLNSGTYVAIIYVDEEGNITNAGATPTTTIENGNAQPITSDGVAEALKLYREKVVSKNQSAVFVNFSNYGVHVEEKQYPSTVGNTWQPIISVSYTQDQKWNSAGFFKNLFCVGNNVRQCSVMLAELSTIGSDAPIVIKKKTITGTTNANGIIYSGNSNLDGSEIFLNAIVTSANDYKTVVGRGSAGEQWLQVYNYDNTVIANTQVTIEIIYFS